MCDTDLEMCGPPRTKRSLDVPGAVGREVVVAFAAALGGHGSGRRGREGDGQGRQRERGDRRRGRSGVGGRRVRWRVLKREPNRRRGQGIQDGGMAIWTFAGAFVHFDGGARVDQALRRSLPPPAHAQGQAAAEDALPSQHPQGTPTRLALKPATHHRQCCDDQQPIPSETRRLDWVADREPRQASPGIPGAKRKNEYAPSHRGR